MAEEKIVNVLPLKAAPSEAEVTFLAENLTKLGDAVEACVNASRAEDEASLRRAIEQTKVIREALKKIECAALCIASNADLRLLRIERGVA